MQVLGQIPLFAGLSQDQLDRVDRRMISLSWAEEDALYTGGPAEHLFVMAAGRAKASQPTVNGQEIVVGFIAPGDLFGGLRSLGQPVYAETTHALTTTCALRIDTRAFRQILVEHPRVALEEVVVEAVQVEHG